MPRPRQGWDDLSEQYRERLISAGRSGELSGSELDEEESRRWWERGGELHVGDRPAPYGAAPIEPTQREQLSLGGSSTWEELQEWRDRMPSRGGPPAWIPNDETMLGNDVAASLSYLSPPTEWEHVQLSFNPDRPGSGTMTVRYYDGTSESIILPDRDAMSEVGSLLRDPTSFAESTREANVLLDEWGIDYDDPDYEPFEVDVDRYTED